MQERGVLIAPSIIAADFSRLGEEVRSAEIGGADMIHVDVMDGHFVPNITMGPLVVESLRGKTELPIDSHLMIENPDNYIDKFIEAGSEMVTVHIEACKHLHRTLTHIKEKGGKAGLSLNPSTPLSTIEHVLEDMDLLLIMTVNPGFAGQSFIKTLVPKIRDARKLISERKLKIDLEVDGGINLETAPIAATAGANILVAGSAVFNKKKSPEENVKDLKRALKTKCPEIQLSKSLSMPPSL